MVRKLQINGKSEQTQQAYTRAVRQLETHCGKNPALISEEELEEYFLSGRIDYFQVELARQALYNAQSLLLNSPHSDDDFLRSSP